MGAIVDSQNRVVGMILMGAADQVAPSGFQIVTLPDDSPVWIGWTLNADGTFTAPA